MTRKENIINKVPYNNNLKLFNGNASVNKYWLTIVEIESIAKLKLTIIGKSSMLGNISKI